MISGKSKSTTNKNEEKVFSGLAKVKEYEGKGYSINLPEIFRILKRKFTQG